MTRYIWRGNTSATLHVERDAVDGSSNEIELEIIGNVTAERPARVHCHPDRACPAEGGDVEIGDVLDANGRPWGGELTEDETERAHEALREAYADACEAAVDGAIDAWDAAWEADRGW